MQAVGLLAKDNFLARYNVSVDASDVVDYILELERYWHSNDSTYENRIDFANEFSADMAKIITAWGVCYCFNVVDAEKLFVLNRQANFFKSFQSSLTCSF